MTPRRRRMTMVIMLLVGIGIAAALAVTAFQSNLLYFINPSEVVAGKAPENRSFRLGGMVKKGSVQRQKDGLTVRFDVTDYAESVTIQYTGILPDLFREEQGIIANGKMNDQGVFVASEVLAKHDEEYMPPEVAASLKKQVINNGSKQGSKP